MKRDLLKRLVTWKNKANRLPLILKGARQVGKTWILKEFGKIEYKNVVYVNFENKEYHKLFEQIPNISQIISSLSFLSQQKIQPNDTLIILDEIQNCPAAITSLKYFNEIAPEYHVAAAGSLLGLYDHYGTGFPVGKVEFLNIYPLNFLEFLDSQNEEQIRTALETLDFNVINFFSKRLHELLYMYYSIGGMPAAINEYTTTNDLKLVRDKHFDILNSYEFDMTHHATPTECARIKMVWNSISSQLAKENNKFMFNVLKKGARAKDFEMAISWLIDCGLINKVTNISRPNIPIKAYENIDFFKLYALDVGLLCAQANLPLNIFSSTNDQFKEFKGAFTEQFVLQQLVSTDQYKSMHYWTSKSHIAEVDFVIQDQEYVIPIEVKATINLKAKSLQQYRINYEPKISVRSSLANFEINNGLYNIPLYAIGLLHQIIEKYDPK